MSDGATGIRYGAGVSLFLYRHALDRMAERGITREEIVQALQSPDTTYTSKDDDTRLVILGKTASGRLLMIVVEKSDHEAIVTVAERD